MVRCSDGQMVSPTGGRIPTTTLTRPLALASRRRSAVACKRAGMLSAHMGHLALHREPRSNQASGAWGLENVVYGATLCPHQR